MQGARRRDVRDESGERGRETVVAESNPANGDYGFVGELWEVKKPSVRGKVGCMCLYVDNWSMLVWWY